MTGLILIEKEILQPNQYGSVFIGAEQGHLKHVCKLGGYPAKRGKEKKGINVLLEQIDSTDTLMLILPYLYSIFFEVHDDKLGKTYKESLFGKDSSLIVGSCQIESLGGKVVYLNNKVRIYSLEAAQEAFKSSRG